MDLIRSIGRQAKAASEELTKSPSCDRICKDVTAAAAHISETHLNDPSLEKISNSAKTTLNNVANSISITTNIPGYTRLRSFYETFEEFIEDWNGKTPKEKSILRDEINTKTMINQSKELQPELSSFHRMTRGTFLIIRVLWDKTGKKSHDHLCFVDWVHGYSIKMIFITDIYEPESKPKTMTWDIRDLNAEFQRGVLKFVKFSGR